MGEAEHILKQCLLGMHTQREGRGKVRVERENEREREHTGIV